MSTRTPPIDVPLGCIADAALERLAAATGSKTIAMLNGSSLLCERAALAGLSVPGRRSAGGGCRLFDAVGDTIAINLARPADRELLPALFQTEDVNPENPVSLAWRFAGSGAAALVARGRSMGLAIASEGESLPLPVTPCVRIASGCPGAAGSRRLPRVLDLSSLWAGPLAAHLLWLAGAEITKVESRARPDALRGGDPRFHALLNQGKASVVVDFEVAAGRQALLSLIAQSDIVIESARPRALAHLGIHADRIVGTTPGLVWVSVTGHGIAGETAGWVGFGDDCGVAGGLSAALRTVTGRTGFVGDAIADPLTGISAALAAWDAYVSGSGGHFVLAMSHVVANAVGIARAADPLGFAASLRAWGAAVGQPFPDIAHRPIGALPALGEHTLSRLGRVGLHPA